jgi:polyisoprenoid-binding protein YceI
MKKVSFFLLGAAFLASSLAFVVPKNPKAPITLAVQSDKSRVDFIGSKSNDFHTGTFNVKGGSVQVEGGKLVGGSFVIDLANLKVTDAAGEKLASHLKSADFFDVAKFGEATYTISSVDYSSTTACTINGTLNVKGVGFPVSFAANIRSASEKGLFGQAYFTLDRTLIGIGYGVPSKDVQIAVHLFAK